MRKSTLPKVDENGVGLYSYSQDNKWKTNRKEYFRQYFFGESFDGNAYTDFGHKVGQAIEDANLNNFDKVEQETLKKVTRLDHFERPINLTLNNFCIRGFIDTCDHTLNTLIDYKTGSVDKESVYSNDDYTQLVIYAAGIEQETGIPPIKAHVELIERTGNPWKGEELCVGKQIIKIPQDISKERVDKVINDVKKNVKEIELYYKVFKKLNSVGV